jgi:hypothetical protein
VIEDKYKHYSVTQDHNLHYIFCNLFDVSFSNGLQLNVRDTHQCLSAKQTERHFLNQSAPCTVHHNVEIIVITRHTVDACCADDLQPLNAYVIYE